MWTIVLYCHYYNNTRSWQIWCMLYNRISGIWPLGPSEAPPAFYCTAHHVYLTWQQINMSPLWPCHDISLNLHDLICLVQDQMTSHYTQTTVSLLLTILLFDLVFPSNKTGFNFIFQSLKNDLEFCTSNCNWLSCNTMGFRFTINYESTHSPHWPPVTIPEDYIYNKRPRQTPVQT